MPGNNIAVTLFFPVTAWKYTYVMHVFLYVVKNENDGVRNAGIRTYNYYVIHTVT